MKPDDVPDELVIAFCWALWGMPPTGETPARQEAREVLAAVLPARDAQIERETRAKVAADIEREADKCDDDPRYNGMMTAADIARGEA